MFKALLVWRVHSVVEVACPTGRWVICPRCGRVSMSKASLAWFVQGVAEVACPTRHWGGVPKLSQRHCVQGDALVAGCSENGELV